MPPRFIIVDMGVGVLIADSGHAFGAKYFQALIIAIDGLSAVINGGDRTVFKFQENNSGIDVADFSDCFIHHYISVGVNFPYFTTHNKSGHIKIVDGHIHKHSTRSTEVFHGRRPRITAGDFKHLQIAYLSSYLPGFLF